MIFKRDTRPRVERREKQRAAEWQESDEPSLPNNTGVDTDFKPARQRRYQAIEALVGERIARGSYMNKCGKINERINAVVDQASRQGIEAKALRKVITVRRKREAAQAVLNILDDELRVSVEQLLTVNDDPNDLPLFKHVTQAAAAMVAAEASLH